MEGIGAEMAGLMRVLSAGASAREAVDPRATTLSIAGSNPFIGPGLSMKAPVASCSSVGISRPLGATEATSWIAVEALLDGLEIHPTTAWHCPRSNQ